MTDLRTPLSRARGRGAAGHGAAHWVAERVSAVALVPLTFWMIYAALTISTAGYSGAVAFVSHPVNAVLILTVLSVTLHMRVGMQVIIEDYVHDKALRVTALFANTIYTVVVAVACFYAILRVGLSRLV